MERLLYVLVILVLSSLSAPLIFWFDSKITRNEHFRLQANFECVFGLFFGTCTLAGFIGPFHHAPLMMFDSRVLTLSLMMYSLLCLFLSIPAMLGRSSANKLLFYLAWPRLLLPCVGWFFSFFAIRYYWKGVRLEREEQLPATGD